MNTNNINKISENKEQDNSVQSERIVTLGEIFQTEREKLDLTVDTVAKRLHLKKSIIVQLENNEYSSIATTFLRGYIRSYAKLLNLKEDDLLTLVDSEKPQETTSPKPLQAFAIKKQKRKRDIWFKVFSGLIVFATIGVTGAWWLQNYQAEQKLQEEVPLANIETSVAHTGNTVSTEVTVSNNTTVSNSNDLPTMLNQNPLIAGDNSSSLNPNNPVSTPPLAPFMVNGELPEINSQTLEDAVNYSLAQKANQEAQDGAEEVIDASKLGIILRFSGDCWAEIADSSGKILFSGLKKKGDELTYTEGAPFKLKLGAPSEVAIDFNGKPFDLSEFAKSGRVAKFTVPLAE